MQTNIIATLVGLMAATALGSAVILPPEKNIDVIAEAMAIAPQPPNGIQPVGFDIRQGLFHFGWERFTEGNGPIYANTLGAPYFVCYSDSLTDPEQRTMACAYHMPYAHYIGYHPTASKIAPWDNIADDLPGRGTGFWTIMAEAPMVVLVTPCPRDCLLP